MRLRIGLAALATAAAGLAGFTWWALDSSGVGVLETRAPDGTRRATRVWFAESGGELWLEAGAPEHPWYRDVQRDPVVSFRALGRWGEYVAQPIEDPQAHARIRSLLREKYGVRDGWVSLLFDTSRSVAVRLSLRPGRGSP